MVAALILEREAVTAAVLDIIIIFRVAVALVGMQETVGFPVIAITPTQLPEPGAVVQAAGRHLLITFLAAAAAV